MSTKELSIEKASHVPGSVKANVVHVSSDGRTIKVEIPTVVVHAKYGKRLHRVVAIHADASEHRAAVGNMVVIAPCRRLSKTKSWKVLSVASSPSAV